MFIRNLITIEKKMNFLIKRKPNHVNNLQSKSKFKFFKNKQINSSPI